MASPKMKINMPGVAPGKEVVGFSIDDETIKDRVERFLGSVRAESKDTGWTSTLYPDHLTLLSATVPGRTTFRFTVSDAHCNRLGNLHGGCTATVFDLCTTTALAPIAKPGFWQFAGVSRGLSVTYLRPVPEGETVLVESEVVGAGKRMCTLRGVMRRESDGEILAVCEHGKVSTDPPLPKL